MMNTLRPVTLLATALAVGLPCSALAGSTVRYLAPLASSAPCDCDISGKAVFRIDDGRRRLSVEIEGFPAGSEFDVVVGGVKVGTIRARASDSGGAVGKLSVSDKIEDGIEDNPRTMFPANFPDLLVGTGIVAGPLAGNFRLRELVTDGSGGTGGSNDTGGAFAGDLECRADALGEDASMDADFRNVSNRMRFSTQFEAAPGGSYSAGDVLEVSVDGERVGTITLAELLGGDLGGDLNLDTRTDDPDAVPFPVEFQGVRLGSIVRVQPTQPEVPALGCSLQPK